jgi:hypothetical protein
VDAACVCTRQGALTEQEEKTPARANAASGQQPHGMWAKWDIPWDGFSVLLGIVGVEVAYVLASIIAPVMVLVNYTDVDRLPPPNLPTDRGAVSSAVTPVRCDVIRSHCQDGMRCNPPLHTVLCHPRRPRRDSRE